MRVAQENLIEPRTLENGTDSLGRSGQRKETAIILDILHGIDQDSQAGAVDVSDTREVDNEARRSINDELVQPRGNIWGNLQIDFAFQGQNILLGREGHTPF